MPVRFRSFAAVVAALVCLSSALPADAGRQIVDLHKLDAYFALFAQDSNVPWKPATVRLDTYSSAPVAFAAYQVDPGDVLTAGSNARPRAIDTRSLRAVATWAFTPPGGYQFQSSDVKVPLGNRQGFFVVEARRGNVGEQVWINRTRIGLLSKETPADVLLYGADLGTGRPLSHMRVQFVVNRSFVVRYTDARGIVTWTTKPRPLFALASWGESVAFLSLLPQVPLPPTIVGVRVSSAVAHAGETLHVVGFARSRNGDVLRPARGAVSIDVRSGATEAVHENATLDAAGAFSLDMTIPASAPAGDYVVLAQTSDGVGGATLHVDANAGGLSLDANAACNGRCDPAKDVPVDIRALRNGAPVAGAPVHVAVIRSPHVYLGVREGETLWATTPWLDRTVTTDAAGRAVIAIPHPTDGLASTYGVTMESAGASAVTRIIVPTAPATVRLEVDRAEQTLGTPIAFDVFATMVAGGAPVRNATVTVALQHGSDAQQQSVTLDAEGHARGTFSSAPLGTNLLTATLTDGGATAMDARAVQVDQQASGSDMSDASGDVRIALDRAGYSVGDAINVAAHLDGADGDALLSFEGAMGAQTLLAPASQGRATGTLHATDATGALAVGAAFVRDGSLEWNDVPVLLRAPGRPAALSLDLAPSYAPGAQAAIPVHGAGQGTLVVRLSRGDPSGSARFDDLADLLAIGATTTQSSAPAGVTYHPWVDSTGQHAQVIGFERRSEPAGAVLAQAASQTIAWSVAPAAASLALTMPHEPGRYVLSVLFLGTDGQVAAATENVVVQ